MELTAETAMEINPRICKAVYEGSGEGSTILYARRSVNSGSDQLQILGNNLTQRLKLCLSCQLIHLVVCLTRGPKPLPKRALHIVRSRVLFLERDYPGKVIMW